MFPPISSPIRNIEIPEVEFSPTPAEANGNNNLAGDDQSSPLFRRRRRPRGRRQHRQRPLSTSGLRPRSPSHPNYKEDAYLLTHVRLQYVGLQAAGSGVSGADSSPERQGMRQGRRRSRRRGQRRRPHTAGGAIAPFPAPMDEVTIVQQPRGSYVLEVFHGFLAVGGKELIDFYLKQNRENKYFCTDTFHFTSRRVDGYPFSLTIYINRNYHVRLSTCCESKRAVGARLGQGSFQLMELTGAVPCIRWVYQTV